MRVQASRQPVKVLVSNYNLKANVNLLLEFGETYRKNCALHYPSLPILPLANPSPMQTVHKCFPEDCLTHPWAHRRRYCVRYATGHEAIGPYEQQPLHFDVPPRTVINHHRLRRAPWLPAAGQPNGLDELV